MTKSSDFSLQDIAQIHRDFHQIYPSDLLEDLSDSEPTVYQEAQILNQLLIDRRSNVVPQPEHTDCLQSSASFVPKQTDILTPGWSRIQRKGQKNWADFQNLMTLYALNQLFPYQIDLPQAQYDYQRLVFAVERFDELKHPTKRHHLSASERLQGKGTYVVFGQRTIDACLHNNPVDVEEQLYLLNREISDAEAGNFYNAQKLRRAYNISQPIVSRLKQRYKT